MRPAGDAGPRPAWRRRCCWPALVAAAGRTTRPAPRPRRPARRRPSRRPSATPPRPRRPRPRRRRRPSRPRKATPTKQARPRASETAHRRPRWPPSRPSGAQPTVRFPKNAAGTRQWRERDGLVGPGLGVGPDGRLLLDVGLPGGAVQPALRHGQLLGLRRQALARRAGGEQGRRLGRRAGLQRGCTTSSSGSGRCGRWTPPGARTPRARARTTTPRWTPTTPRRSTAATSAARRRASSTPTTPTARAIDVNDFENPYIADDGTIYPDALLRPPPLAGARGLLVQLQRRGARVHPRGMTLGRSLVAPGLPALRRPMMLRRNRFCRRHRAGGAGAAAPVAARRRRRWRRRRSAAGQPRRPRTTSPDADPHRRPRRRPTRRRRGRRPRRPTPDRRKPAPKPTAKKTDHSRPPRPARCRPG